MLALCPTSRVAFWITCLATLVVLFTPIKAASAQGEVLSTNEREAVALAEAGELAAENGRWADAVVAFRRAYGISPAYTLLFNLGYALRALGNYRESRNTFQRLLEDHDDVPPDIQEAARTVMAEVDERVVRISLRGVVQDANQEVYLDGRNVDDFGERPLVIETDPGERSLSLRRAGYEDFSWRGSVAPGERISLMVDYTALPEADTRSLFSRPAFWIVLGVVLASVAGTTWYLLDRDAQLEPTDPTMHISLHGLSP